MTNTLLSHSNTFTRTNLLPVPEPIPSSHATSDCNKKMFLIKNKSLAFQTNL